MLLNGDAGGGRARRLEAALRDATHALAPSAAFEMPATVADARRCVEHSPPGRRVVVIGGDGSAHALLPALLAGGHELALVPAGSGEDAARAFGLRGRPWRDALGLALAAPARPIDVGRLRTEHDARPFVSSLCMGFDAAIAARASRGPRALGGLLRYLLATLTEIAHLRRWHLNVTVDGHTLHDGPALFASALNTPTYGGGMPVLPAARIDDGRLDLIVAMRFGRLGALAMLPRLLLGHHLGHAQVASARFAHLRVRADRPLPLAADGEPIAAAREVDVRVQTGALRVVTVDTPRQAATHA